MKVKIIGILALICLFMSSMNLFTQSYEQLWKEIEKAISEGLPQTAMKYTEDVYRKAEAENNAGQMLKAYTARFMLREQLDPDSFYVDLKAMEQKAATTTAHEECAILHTLLAQQYSDYAASNSYSLRQRTDVQDGYPDDMREWGKNMFVQKVLDHTHAALEDATGLFATTTDLYVPFVEKQKHSKYYNHNLYQLLAANAIASLQRVTILGGDSIITNEIAAIYSTLEGLYREQDNKDALALLSLEVVEWKKETNTIKEDDYLPALDKLIAEYGDRPVSVEIYLAKVKHLNDDDKKVEALAVCKEAVDRHPKYDRINAIKNIQADIVAPSLSVRVPGVAYPGDTLTMNVQYSNIDGFTANLYKINLPGNSPLLENIQEAANRKKYASAKVMSQHYKLERTTDYLEADSTMNLIVPQEGLYLIELVPDKAKASNKQLDVLSVTRLKALTRSLPGDRFEVAVLDSKSGQPVADATVHLYTVNKGNRVLSQTITTGADGRVETDWNKEHRYISVEKGTDKATITRYIYGGRYWSSFEDEIKSRKVVLLTDRALYRPGQTIYLKGIVYNQKGEETKVLPNAKYTVSLRDANSREVDKKELNTNEFGSFTAEFTIPSGGLNGMYSIVTEGAQTNIRVEEYKRPTFEITLDKPEGSYKLGDTIQLKGTAQTYSGVPMQGLTVNYTVSRSMYGWWRQYYSAGIIASGEAQMDNNGAFALPVALTPDADYKQDMGYFTYTVTATVTSEAGETQRVTTALSAGNRSLLLSVDVPQLINKDADIALTFNACNLNSQPVDVKGEYKLYPYTDYKAEKTAETPAYKGAFTSNVSTALPEWKSLPSGVYKLKLSAKDEQGREASFETEVVLFSVDDKRPAKKLGIWFYSINSEFDANTPGEFIFGTPDKDAYVLMDVFAGNKRLESRAIHLSDSVMRFTYPYKAEYGDGLGFTFCYVKNGQVQAYTASLKKKAPEKELKMVWSVFRDKLRPGQQEEWRLTIRTPDNSFADAEMLATMYDASLDQIWKKDQALKLYFSRTLTHISWNADHSSTNFFRFWFDRKTLRAPQLAYDAFWATDFFAKEQLMYEYSTAPMVRGRSSNNIMMKSAAVESVEASYDMVATEDSGSIDEMEAQTGGGALPEATADVRTNFAETAFFYPQLRTNEQGEVVIAFTMPESLTRWSFNGYAHTKDMLNGMISAQAVTSKEFMLTPNLPRFVRVGDETSVTASVANLTKEAVKGNVTFTLFDPLTEKVIAVQKQKFSAEAGQTQTVAFAFTATDKHQLLGCRIVADGGSFSDGEQHLLPVLSNKERIIETVAMPIRGNQTREFSFAGLFNGNSKTATNRSMTVEFSGNPAWYAVQALPSLSLPTDDNAISWATAYYANSLASFIMNSQPRLKAVFDAWKAQGGTKETFLSNLQKNQDVKGILLEESPWIMEAKTEQEQRERIATLFDLNNIRNNNLTAINKLSDLQLSNGSWTWYKGMTGSRYITNYVVQQLARLTHLAGANSDREVTNMMTKAFRFLHNDALTLYNDMRKAEKKGTTFNGLLGSALQYLYLIAIANEPVPSVNKTAYNYFLDKVKGNLSGKDITQKAVSAVILHKAGRTNDAAAFIASLKEYTTQTDEMGMYFAFNADPYSWSGLKVPAHVAVMEAFDLTGKDALAVEEMKLWLLKQKQTQQWDSPVSTANAVYALLCRGSNLIANQGDVRIVLGNKVIETLAPAQSTVPGMAYVKETITDKSDLQKIKKAVVEKRDAGIAWGAVYAQYEEDIDKVTSHSEGLSVEKTLYVERVTGDKKELLPIGADNSLKAGDKVVSRLVIKLDRSMDFVQLKDQRAACFEPIDNLSGYRWGAGTGYYVAVKDASTNFFFDSLSKGVYVLEHSYRVSRPGTYEAGLAVIQSAYAPEYTAHSASTKLAIKK